MSDEMNKGERLKNRSREIITKIDDFYSKNEPLITLLSKIGDTLILVILTFSLWIMPIEAPSAYSEMIVITFKLVVSIWFINIFINTWRRQNEESKFLRKILSLTAVIVIV